MRHKWLLKTILNCIFFYVDVDLRDQAGCVGAVELKDELRTPHGSDGKTNINADGTCFCSFFSMKEIFNISSEKPLRYCVDS